MKLEGTDSVTSGSTSVSMPSFMKQICRLVPPCMRACRLGFLASPRSVRHASRSDAHTSSSVPIASLRRISSRSLWCAWGKREREMFYLTTHSTHFIYGYMASDIWLRTILIVRKEIRCRHIGYSYRLTARVLLYAPSHRQDNTYHGLSYTSHGALAGTRNSSMGPGERKRNLKNFI